MDASAASDARWTRVCAAYAEALNLPDAAREAFLVRLAAADDGLAGEVRSLLGCVPDAERFFDRPTGLAGLLTAFADAPPERLGAYALHHELGRGGMGTVYLAERADGTFHKRVALKLIRRGLDTDDVLERFARERQVLARLDHPGIARLLDGGAAPDGRPYLVMEYVEGTPLGAFCDRHRLPIEARLALLVRVCEAVQYAHQNLVVHRDLKPSNILVTEAGEVKLLDFGIARLLEDGDAHLTRSEARRLTPAYAAPEQQRGQPVTTAADVFSLGVLLYELLTGHRPYDLSPDPGAPVRPSLAVQQPSRRHSSAGETGAAAPGVAADARRTTVPRLGRRLAGDLDTICLRALHEDPARRYPSAEALAADVRRHLDGLPVTARADSAAYRAGRFLRRHRVGAALTAGAVLLLVAVTLFTLVQQRATARERDRAEQVTALLKGLFQEANPRYGGGPGTTVEQVLDRGVATLSGDATLPSDVKAELFSLIASVYRDLGAHEPALATYRRALALYDAARAPAAYGSVLTQMGATYHLGGHLDSADAVLRRAEALLTPTDDDDARGEMLNERGEILIQQGDYPRADSALRASAAHVLRAGGPASSDYATALLDLGMLFNKWGRYDSAEVYQRRGLEVARARLGPDHLDVATAENTLGATLYRLGRLGEAEALHRHALAVRRRHLPADHPQVATAWGNLANVLRDAGRFDEAADAMTRAYEIDLRARGPEAPNTVISHYNLALVRQAQGAHAEAEALLRASVQMHERVWPGGHPYTAFPLTALGQVLLDAGRPAEAERVLRDALRIRRARLAPEDWLTAQAASLLGTALARLGRAAEAEPLLVDGYAGIENTRGRADRHTQRALEALAAFYDARGDAEAAARYRERIAKK